MPKSMRRLLTTTSGNWVPLAVLLISTRAAAYDDAPAGEELAIDSTASALTSRGSDWALRSRSDEGERVGFLEGDRVGFLEPSTMPTASVTFRCHQMLWLGSWLLLATFLFTMATLLSVYITASVPELKYVFPLAVDALDKFPVSCFLSIGLFVSIPAIATLVTLHFGLQGRLEFLHIPKNGGTSVELAGMRGGIRWSAESVGFAGIQYMPDGSTCANYHVPPKLYRGGMYSNAHVFCIIRHPFERAVSEYQYLLNDELQATTAVSWGWQYYKRYSNGLYDYEPCTSKGLNHFVQTTLALYSEGNKYIDDCHHVAQNEFIWDDEGNKKCDSVLRLESLAEEFNSLMMTHGYQVRINPNPYYSSSELCPNISVDSLTDRSKQMLREVYADDFRLLQFDPF